MLKINFYPEYDNQEVAIGAREYQGIWNNDGQQIVTSFKNITGLRFFEREINAIVFDKGIPRSHPMCLRANEKSWVKKSVLIHELAHRLVVGNNITISNKIRSETKSEDVHRFLYLFLYDVWTDVYGGELADKSVEREKSLSDVYKNAWEWALKFSREERNQKFKERIRKSNY